jgi:hypothetical protein
MPQRPANVKARKPKGMEKMDVKHIARAIEMLEVAARLIEENAEYATIDYDGATCDGACVAEDCRAAAEGLLAIHGEARNG